MELQDWELRELEKIRRSRELNLKQVYFETTDPAERKNILEKMRESKEDAEFVEICDEMYEHRYIPKEKGVKQIDYAIKAWLNMKFLPEAARSIFSKGKLGSRIKEVRDDLGYSICEKYGQLGKEFISKELCNVVRVYLSLCVSDRSYGSIIFGLGRMKGDKLMAKIARDIVTVTYSIPKEIGMLREFEELAQAGKTVFTEKYPNEAMFYEELLDEADQKVKPIKKE